jgi:hypothetical protein
MEKCKAPDIFEWVLYEMRHQSAVFTVGFMKLLDLALPNAIAGEWREVSIDAYLHSLPYPDVV